MVRFSIGRIGSSARTRTRNSSADELTAELQVLSKRIGSSARTRTWNPSVNNCEKGFQRQTVRRGETLPHAVEARMFTGDCTSAAVATHGEAFRLVLKQGRHKIGHNFSPHFCARIGYDGPPRGLLAHPEPILTRWRGILANLPTTEGHPRGAESRSSTLPSWWGRRGGSPQIPPRALGAAPCTPGAAGLPCSESTGKREGTRRRGHLRRRQPRRDGWRQPLIRCLPPRRRRSIRATE